MASSPTPATCIEYTGTTVPVPKFQIGQEVLFVIRDIDGNYFDDLYLRHLIKHMRSIIDDPEMLEFTGRKTNIMPEHNKQMIRDQMRIYRTAKKSTVIIAGIAPEYGHNIDAPAFNKCYLNRGSCHSGLSYVYHMCIMHMIDGKECAMVTSMGFPEICFQPLPTE